MVTFFYAFLLFICILLIIYMAQKNYEHIDIYYWTIVVIIPLIILGYALKSQVTTAEGAYIAFCYIYLDSTVLLTVAIFCITHFMGLYVKKWIKVVAYSAAFLHMTMVWACLHNGLYYKDIFLIDTGYGIATKMVSGPLKVLHWIYIVIILLSILILMSIALLKRGTYSRKTLLLYTILTGTGLITYVLESLFDVYFSFLPVVYTAAELLIAVNYDNSHAHDIMSIISEKQKYHESIGYAAFDLEGRYLSCNEKMLEFLPQLAIQIVDAKLDEGSQLADIFYDLIEKFKKSEKPVKKIELNNIYCQCDVSEFSIRKDGKVQGYLFSMRDITEEQKVLSVMQDYNETLNAEVNKKTERLKDIQEKVVLGLANMVENRDESIGGHVKRTSDIIKIFVEEARKQGVYDITARMAECIIRSAPMHDLGKITIDSAIIKKKERLTDEEYEIFKTHPIKSGEFVNIILRDVDEQDFGVVAYNVARFHHERWDGRGYPDGLVGTMIPLEARIMSVVNYYDTALRLNFKDGVLPFETAAEEIISGMGTKYDPNLLPVFNGCRDKLEEYYRNRQSQRV